MYALIENNAVKQYPYGADVLRRDNPQTSFPENPTNELLADWGVLPVIRTEIPTHDPVTQNVTDSVELQNGQWVQVWSIVEASEAEVTERTQQLKDANAARAKALLLDTDWSENASVRNTSMTPHLVNGSDFDTYRVILRAVAVQRPLTVSEWPVRPDAIWSTEVEQ